MSVTPFSLHMLRCPCRRAWNPFTHRSMHETWAVISPCASQQRCSERCAGRCHDNTVHYHHQEQTGWRCLPPFLMISCTFEFWIITFFSFVLLPRPRPLLIPYKLTTSLSRAGGDLEGREGWLSVLTLSRNGFERGEESHESLRPHFYCFERGHSLRYVNKVLCLNLWQFIRIFL